MLLVDRTLLNPYAKLLFLVVAESLFRGWRRHNERLVARVDARDQFTLKCCTWNGNASCDCIVGEIESQVGLSMAGIRAMARETEFGQDRSDIAVELQIVPLCVLT